MSSNEVNIVNDKVDEIDIPKIRIWDLIRLLSSTHHISQGMVERFRHSTVLILHINSAAVQGQMKFGLFHCDGQDIRISRANEVYRHVTGQEPPGNWDEVIELNVAVRS